jgi:hypothetical protein
MQNYKNIPNYPNVIIKIVLCTSGSFRNLISAKILAQVIEGISLFFHGEEVKK